MVEHVAVNHGVEGSNPPWVARKIIMSIINKASSSKKQWCGNKVGIDHKLKCIPAKESKLFPIIYDDGEYILLCSECGKELDYYLNFQGKLENMPDWLLKYLEDKDENLETTISGASEQA